MAILKRPVQCFLTQGHNHDDFAILVLLNLQMESMVKQTEDTLGPVDIIVNCAGVMYYTMMKNLHLDEWERTVDINCKVRSVITVYDGN